VKTANYTDAMTMQLNSGAISVLCRRL